MANEPWVRRAKRARVLAERYRASRDILTFYAGLADWQATVDRATLKRLKPCLPSLLELVDRTGPPLLAEAARAFATDGFDRLIEDYWEAELPPSALEFFARAILQPHAATYPEGFDCPWCRRDPLVGVLRPQGEGLAFSVVCSLCLRARSEPRQRCPGCGETSKEKLAHFQTPDFPHLRLNACESCRGYLCVVDLSNDPRAIPEVDELAAGPLDLWAIEQGYQKLQPNIIGI